jgi:predicted PurR-regulated permease PerM
MVIFRFYWVKVNETLKLKNLEKIKQTTSFDVPGDINNIINNNIMIINNINNVNINNINNITNINNIDINNINNFNNINNIKNLINKSYGKTKEITTVSVVLYVIKFMLFYINFSFDFLRFENVCF